jgi:Bardet-Biedl syndrome 1 protein
MRMRRARQPVHYPLPHLQTITDGTTSLGPTSGSSLRLNATVTGLGPLFKIKLDIQNVGATPAYDVTVAYAFNPEVYRVPEAATLLPLLLPSVHYLVECSLLCIDEGGAADAVRVFVTRGRSVVPAISAVINMPVAQVLAGR